VEGLSPGYVFGGIGKQRSILVGEGIKFIPGGKVKT